MTGVNVWGFLIDWSSDKLYDKNVAFYEWLRFYIIGYEKTLKSLKLEDYMIRVHISGEPQEQIFYEQR